MLGVGERRREARVVTPMTRRMPRSECPIGGIKAGRVAVVVAETKGVKEGGSRSSGAAREGPDAKLN